MTPLDKVLQAYKSGSLSLDEAIRRINGGLTQDLGHTTIDHDRLRRTGASEVIYGAHKTPAQVRDAFDALAKSDQNVLVTRADPAHFDAVTEDYPQATYHDVARLIEFKQYTRPTVATSIGVISAGTSDHAVAEEAALTAEFFDNTVLRVRDVGVAGLHRLLGRLDEIRSARVLIVVAGMEGALPSVVGGLVDKPVIAVPTSVGYGAAFGGVAALLGMLNSCASGVSVVNIDNGFGAGFLANTINRL